MTITGRKSRKEVQGDRIRMAVGLRDSSVRRLHAELIKSGEDMGVYETFRKQTRGIGQNLSYGVLKAIAAITGAPLDWIAGDDGAVWSELTEGVQFSSECTDGTDCPDYVDAKGKCVRIDHCLLVLKRVA